MGATACALLGTLVALAAAPTLAGPESRVATRLTLELPALDPAPPAFPVEDLATLALDQGGGARGVESPWIAALMSGVIGFGAGHAMVGARSDAFIWLGIDAGATLTGILIGVIAEHGAVWGVVAVALVGGRVVEAMDAFGKGEHVDPGDPLSRKPLVDEDGRPRSSVADGDRRVHDLDDERTRREAEEAEEPPRKAPAPVEDEEAAPEADEDEKRLEEGALPVALDARPT